MAIDQDPLFKVRKEQLALVQTRTDLSQLVTPKTMGARFLTAVGSLLPERVRDRFRPNPLDELSAQLRESTLSLRTSLPLLLKEGQEKVIDHNAMVQLIEICEQNGSESGVWDRLRSYLRARAEKELGLHPDKDVDDLVKLVLQGTPESQSGYRRLLLEEARSYVDLTGPTIDTLQTVLVGSIHACESQTARYSTFLKNKQTWQLIQAAGENIVEAERLGITQFQVVTSTLGQAIEAASLAIQASEVGRELVLTSNRETLLDLQKKAQALLQKSHLPTGSQVFPQLSSKK